MARAKHVCRAGDRAADGPFVDPFAAGLDASAQHRVGCATDAQLAVLRFLQNLKTRLKGKSEGLFAVGVLAGLERLQIHRGMRGGDSQVEHRVDLRIRQHFIDGTSPGHAMFRGLGLGALEIKIGAGGNFRVGRKWREVLEIGVADIPATHQPDAQRKMIRGHSLFYFSILENPIRLYHDFAVLCSKSRYSPYEH